MYLQAWYKHKGWVASVTSPTQFQLRVKPSSAPTLKHIGQNPPRLHHRAVYPTQTYTTQFYLVLRDEDTQGMPPRLPHIITTTSCPLAQSILQCCVTRKSAAAATHGLSIASTSAPARQSLLLRCCNGSSKRRFHATRDLAQSAFEGKNHYERLKVPLNASMGEIKKSRSPSSSCNRSQYLTNLLGLSMRYPRLTTQTQIDPTSTPLTTSPSSPNLTPSSLTLPAAPPTIATSCAFTTSILTTLTKPPTTARIPPAAVHPPAWVAAEEPSAAPLQASTVMADGARTPTSATRHTRSLPAALTPAQHRPHLKRTAPIHGTRAPSTRRIITTAAWVRGLTLSTTETSTCRTLTRPATWGRTSSRITAGGSARRGPLGMMTLSLSRRRAWRGTFWSWRAYWRRRFWRQRCICSLCA